MFNISFPNNIVINGLNIVLISSSNPESYIVKDKNDRYVGYIQLHSGVLTCEYPDTGGRVIYNKKLYDASIENSGFKSNIERSAHLLDICNFIGKEMEEEEKAMQVPEADNDHFISVAQLLFSEAGVVNFGEPFAYTIKQIKNFPRVPVRPIIKAYWKPDGYGNLWCSHCNHCGANDGIATLFCCNCGAEMEIRE